MKKFIFKIGLFLLPILIIAGGGEVLLRSVPNMYRTKRAYLNDHAAETEVVFLGSSHALYGVDPQYLSRPSFNAANVSQSLDYDLAILQRFFSDSPSLRVIGLPVSVFSLHTLLSQSKENWRRNRYDFYYGLLSDGQRIQTPFEIMINSPMDSIKHLKRYYLKKISSESSRLGFGLNFRFDQRTDPESGSVTAAKRHMEAIENGDYNQTVKYLREIIEFAQERDILVLLYTPPAYKSYVSLIEGDELDLVRNTALSMANSNENVLYIDLLNDPHFLNDDYYDSDHLNEIGAKKLTLMLDTEIEKMIR